MRRGAESHTAHESSNWLLESGSVIIVKRRGRKEVCILINDGGETLYRRLREELVGDLAEKVVAEVASRKFDELGGGGVSALFEVVIGRIRAFTCSQWPRLGP